MNNCCALIFHGANSEKSETPPSRKRWQLIACMLSGRQSGALISYHSISMSRSGWDCPPVPRKTPAGYRRPLAPDATYSNQFPGAAVYRMARFTSYRAIRARGIVWSVCGYG